MKGKGATFFGKVAKLVGKVANYFGKVANSGAKTTGDVALLNAVGVTAREPF